MLLLLGMLDFGRAFNYWLDQTHIANEGSRWAIVNTNPGAGASPSQTLQRYLQCSADTRELKNGGTSSVPNPMTVTISFPSGQALTQPVKVTTSTTFNLIPFIGRAASNITGLNLTASSTMRIEQPPSTVPIGSWAYGGGTGGTGVGGCP